MDLRELQLQERNDLIVRASVELLQSVLPTNIFNCLDDDLSSEGSARDAADDFDESRFFYEMLQPKRRTIPLKLPLGKVTNGGSEGSPKRKHTDIAAETPRWNSAQRSAKTAKRNLDARDADTPGRNGGEAVDEIDCMESDDDEDDLISVGSAASLTLVEIDELEMLSLLSVKPEDIQFLGHMLSSANVVEENWLKELGVHTIHRLTNIFVYSLMCEHDLDAVDGKFFLASGVAKRVTYKVCGFIAAHQSLFFRLPNETEIEQNVLEFAGLGDFVEHEFKSIFGAMGSIDIDVSPGLAGHFAISTEHDSSATVTPVKLQCSCDANGFLQSCFVLVPSVELDTKNVEAFVQSPLYAALETRPTDGNYMVADNSFSTVPVLLTPRDSDDQSAAVFNRVLESKRAVIDRAFALIRSRFSILDRIDCDDAHIVRDLIVSVCVLYNVFVANDRMVYEIVD